MTLKPSLDLGCEIGLILLANGEVRFEVNRDKILMILPVAAVDVDTSSCVGEWQRMARLLVCSRSGRDRRAHGTYLEMNKSPFNG